MMCNERMNTIVELIVQFRCDTEGKIEMKGLRKERKMFEGKNGMSAG